MASKTFKNISWDDISNLVGDILLKIKSENIKIDSILGIARGGMIPASIISYQLENNYLEMLGVRTRDVNNTQFYGDPSLFGNVLVVDDINDSGKTFEEVSKYLEYHFDRGEIKNIYYSACIQRSSSKWKKGFYGSTYNSKAWYVFPWDKQ